MATYTIIHSPERASYEVAIVTAAGARQTMLGFKNEADAEAWIVQDKRLNDAADPWRPTKFKPRG